MTRDGGRSIDVDDGDQLMNVITVVLVLAVVAGTGVVVLAAMDPSAQRADAVPDANWTLERVNATHVRLVHDGGDAVAAADLAVTVNGKERHPTWSGRLSTGDSGVVRARETTLVRLYWIGGSGDWVWLADWRV